MADITCRSAVCLSSEYINTTRINIPWLCPWCCSSSTTCCIHWSLFSLHILPSVAFLLTNSDSLGAFSFCFIPNSRSLLSLSKLAEGCIDLHEVLIHIVSPPAVPALSGDWRRTDGWSAWYSFSRISATTPHLPRHTQASHPFFFLLIWLHSSFLASNGVI